MINFEALTKRAEELNTNLCFGVDPVMEKIAPDSIAAEIGESIRAYYYEMIDKLIGENQIVAIKPNYAFFAQYGFSGLNALKSIIDKYSGKVEIIFDGKRGDIGKSSQAYAKELFDFWNADAVTVSPYMGKDSIMPFLRANKLVYLLCRTSNSGASDMQEKGIGSNRVYDLVIKMAKELGTGLVVGATSDAISAISRDTEGKIPLLIPGIGAQAGDLEMTVKAISGSFFSHRISVSSSIAYAYEQSKNDPATAALQAAKKLNADISIYKH